MKIFAIRDEEMRPRTDLAYLFYYPGTGAFHIEIPEAVDPWQLPVMLSQFALKGQLTLDSDWSLVWVRERIVPPDRQNLGQILRDNGIDTYDEYKLLLLYHGRCAQDSCYLAEVSEDDMPAEVRDRNKYCVRDILPLGKDCVVAFGDGELRRACLSDHISHHGEQYRRLLTYQNLLIPPDGYGISIGGQFRIDGRELYERSERLPGNRNQLVDYLRSSLMGTADTMEYLGCSRQYLNRLVQQGQLQPVRRDGRDTIFLRSDVVWYKRFA